MRRLGSRAVGHAMGASGVIAIGGIMQNHAKSVNAGSMEPICYDYSVKNAEVEHANTHSRCWIRAHGGLVGRSRRRFDAMAIDGGQGHRLPEIVARARRKLVVEPQPRRH